MSNETLLEAAKVAPPLSVTGLHFMGVSIADWVSLVTLVYVICLLVDAAPKAYSRLSIWWKLWVSKQDLPPQG